MLRILRTAIVFGTIAIAIPLCAADSRTQPSITSVEPATKFGLEAGDSAEQNADDKGAPSEDVKDCLAELDSTMYALFLGEFPPRRTADGLLMCHVDYRPRAATNPDERKRLDCTGSDCHQDIDSMFSLDFISGAEGRGECSVTIRYEKSNCTKRAEALEGRRLQNRFYEHPFTCELTQDECDDFFRVLVCEYGVRDRAEYLGLLHSDGTVDRTKCARYE